jgi:hypothetical protein
MRADAVSIARATCATAGSGSDEAAAEVARTGYYGFFDRFPGHETDGSWSEWLQQLIREAEAACPKVAALVLKADHDHA